MNEADTRAERIEPQLRAAGWGVVPGSRILREFQINAGRIMVGRGREKPLIADYIVEYNRRKLAIIEAKCDEVPVGEGVAQAKNYAHKMQLTYTFAANGNSIYQINMLSGAEGDVLKFPTPQELWDLTFAQQNDWLEKFNQVPYEDVGGSKELRYYQEIAVNKTMAAIAEGQQRILLTLATGTGKTFIAFQIAWKLYQTRWNLQRNGKRIPRILFLADRNILADQAFNTFSAFPEDALVRIRPNQITKLGRVPTNGSIFFTIFQTFMSGEEEQYNFGEYPRDFFDFIVIDECHRGGANDESTWRKIMEYFEPAVQLGLTATPRRSDNIDTYRYFGEPVYVYSLKDGINDGFLTPFKVKRIQTTLDDYIYTSDDQVLEGEIESGRLYKEADFNRIIEIKAREKKRVEIFLNDINQREKTLVFCASQDHALAVRDLVNQLNAVHHPHYCVRVTANEGELGEQYLREFQDNEKTIPTILTTSHKLSTGVDARNVRNIVLMRPIHSMIEFKQIIGRGTRLYEDKQFFTIYDFVSAYHHFSDPEWDGDPLPPEGEPKPLKGGVKEGEGEVYVVEDENERERKKIIVRVKLADGKERQIQYMQQTSFWDADGKPISVEEFLHKLFGELPGFFRDEEELRRIWSNPNTRQAFLERLANAGFGKATLATLQNLINAENSDLFDVLKYIATADPPISREVRVAHSQPRIFKALTLHEKEFIEFVLSQYITSGVDELAVEKLPELLKIKYFTLPDAIRMLGDVKVIRELFIGFQMELYGMGRG
ncbi:MAG: DEAD/DEAH box helicase family protein [Anaerolineaceae bacterium]|nr:DEAD/DEAH box helicase family protein [Anaerolineaceae bacterium]